MVIFFERLEDVEHTRRAEEPFYGFQEDREAKCEQEDSIDQSREDFRPMPAIGITRVDMSLVGQLVGTCIGQGI